VIRMPLGLAAVVVALIVPSVARGAGGHYVLDGGTPAERHTVVAALQASSFDWSVVPAVITIHVVRGADSFAIPGEISLDADLLDAGTFAWGVVQHEYAHQVDYLRFDEGLRARFLKLLGATEWCYGTAPVRPHAVYGCERFASTLAWAYWQSPDNCMKPTSPTDESAAMSPRRFRAAVDAALGRSAKKRDKGRS
jgi:hypothetical protein